MKLEVCFITLLAISSHFATSLGELSTQNQNESKSNSELKEIPWCIPAPGDYEADQIHLSLGSNSRELYATWMTRERVETSKLKYFMTHSGIDGPEKVVQATLFETVITEKNSKRTLHTYRAKMKDLSPGLAYKYWIVNDNNNLSFESQKRTISIENLTNPNQEISIAFYGDLGLANGTKTISRLREDLSNAAYKMIIHNGDFAYNLDTQHGAYGDMFMRLMEPIVSQVPYQTSVGNHELAENFTHYDARFTMINSGGTDDGQMNNFYYSFNVGPIHFVSFSTEFYYFVESSGLPVLHAQYEWLKRDLSFASSLEQRKLRPWIIVFGHRPMYCSSDAPSEKSCHDDCAVNLNLIRRGFAGAFGLEGLFYKFGVDIELYSHEHNYERFLPIYDKQVYRGTDDDDDSYYNPLAPVHITSGAAGSNEGLDLFKDQPKPGSVKRIDKKLGYLRIKATRCRIYFQQVSSEEGGKILDSFVVSKTRQNFPTKTEELYMCNQKSVQEAPDTGEL